MKNVLLLLATMCSAPALAQSVNTPPAQSAPPAPAYAAPVPSMWPEYLLHDNYNFSVPGRGALRTRADVVTQYHTALAIAKCAARSNEAAPALQTAIGSRDEQQRVTTLYRQNAECGTPASALTIPLLRGALSEVRVRNAAPSHAIAGHPGLDQALPESARSALLIAQCHVRADPHAAYAVLGTQPGSAAEKDAEGDLFRKVPSCGGGTRPGHLDAVTYRVMLADMLGGAVANTN